MPTEAANIARALKLHRLARTAAEPEIKDINRNLRAYHIVDHGTWESDDVAALKQRQLPVLNLNKVKPTVNGIVGLEQQTDVMMRVLPERSEDTLLAAALDAIANRRHYDLDAGDLRMTAFQMAVVSRRAHIGHAPILERGAPSHTMFFVDPRECFIDPASTAYDPDTDANYIALERYVPTFSLLNEFEEKAREIKQLEDHLQKEASTTWPGFAARTPGEDYAVENEARQMLRMEHKTGNPQVIHVIERESNNVYELLEIDTGYREEFKSRKEMMDAYQEMTETLPQFAAGVFPRTFRATRMKEYMIAGGRLLLRGGDMDGPTNMGFPISTWRAHHLGGITSCTVDDLIDPQRQHNKTWSNWVHIMSSVAQAGWYNPSRSGIPDKWFEEHGAETGLVVNYMPPWKPERITPDLSGITHFADMGFTDQQIKEIGGYVETLRGIAPGRVESGVGVDMLQRSGLVVLAMLYANMLRSERANFLKMCQMIQHYMPVPDEIEIVGTDLRRRLEKAMPTDMIRSAAGQHWARLSVLGGINALETLRFKVRVAEGPATRTQREYWLQYLMQIAGQMPGAVPPQILVGLMDIPQKDEIIEQLEQQQELAEEIQGLQAGSQLAAAMSGGGA